MMTNSEIKNLTHENLKKYFLKKQKFKNLLDLYISRQLDGIFPTQITDCWNKVGKTSKIIYLSPFLDKS